MDTDTGRPKSPDWLRDFQAPESYSVPSSPSSSSAKSDVGKETGGKSSGCSVGVAPKENVHSLERSGKASSRKQGSGKKEGTPRANAKRKEAGSKRGASPSRKRKEVAQPSPDKIVILDDDDDDDGPVGGGLSRMSSSSVRRKPAADSGKPPSVLKEKKSTVKKSLRQATLSSLFDARLLSQESETPVLEVELVDSQREIEDSQQNVVASQADVVASQSDMVGSRPEDPAIEEGADLKNEEDIVGSQEPRAKAKVPSCLPLVFPEKVHLTKVLVECDGDSLDLSGDMGAVGRFSVSGKNADELLVDLKGVIYRAGIVPSSTFMVVNIGPNEAKVEAVMSDFMQLRVDTDRHEDETMVEGTLDGFTLGSDDEGVRPSTQPPAQDDGFGTASVEPAKKAKKASQTKQKLAKKVVVKKTKVVKVSRASKAGSKVVGVKRSKPPPKTTKKQAK